MTVEGGPLVLGIDLGGTKVLSAVVDSRNAILGRAKTSTPSKQGEAAILRAVRDCAEQALREAGVSASEIAGICIGSPGPLDTERGMILYSANLRVREFAIGPELSEALGRPVMVQNDVRVGGYGEFRLGAGRGHRNVLAAFVGTGLGGCVIVDGHVLSGATGNAGEVGHIVIKPRGRQCGCGRRGCLETLASRSAIVRRIAKAHARGFPTVLGQRVAEKGERLKSRDLASAYAAHDPLTVREIGRAAYYLGLGLGSLINVLGPEVVIIGGGLTEAIGEPYLDLVREATRPQILFDPEHSIAIVGASLGDDSGILGAALMAREAFAPSV